MTAKIRYGYLWRFRARLRRLRLGYTRRVLWRCFSTKAVYKPYGANKGSGWHGRWVWRNRVIAYVDKYGGIWT